MVQIPAWAFGIGWGVMAALSFMVGYFWVQTWSARQARYKAEHELGVSDARYAREADANQTLRDLNKRSEARGDRLWAALNRINAASGAVEATPSDRLLSIDRQLAATFKREHEEGKS